MNIKYAFVIYISVRRTLLFFSHGKREYCKKQSQSKHYVRTLRCFIENKPANFYLDKKNQFYDKYIVNVFQKSFPKTLNLTQKWHMRTIRT